LWKLKLSLGGFWLDEIVKFRTFIIFKNATILTEKSSNFFFYWRTMKKWQLVKQHLKSKTVSRKGGSVKHIIVISLNLLPDETISLVSLSISDFPRK